ncbi:uncharacterized protein [Diabrotica undecimpunctata]|uniref:uncharacterized protein n=1 Tax=Diabrotica undecimpunctata TaxID=50387 RepID=UPI003B639BD8
MYTENILRDYQAGFRKNLSTSGHVFMLKQVLSRAYEYDIPTHVLFVDFKGAYDNVGRSKLMKALQEFKILSKIIRLVHMTLQNTQAQLILMKRRDNNMNTAETIFNKSHQCLAYADNVVLLAMSRTELEKIAKNFLEVAGNEGLQINLNKTKYMELKNRQKKSRKLNVEILLGREIL